MNEIFRKFAQRTSEIVGSPGAFILAFMLLVGWALSGPIFQFSDTWQLVINTATTIITFLMVFVIQNTQNRDARAIHLKLDELIRSSKSARDFMVSLEQLSDEDLAALQKQFERIGQHYERVVNTVEEAVDTIQDELQDTDEQTSGLDRAQKEQ